MTSDKTSRSLRIAISAVLFSNDRLIGAQRARALAECLARRGNSVTVFTPTVPDEIYTAPPPGVEMVELPLYAPQAWLPMNKIPFWQRLIAFASIAHTVPRARILSSPRFSGLLHLDESERVRAFEALNERRRLTTAQTRAMLDAATWSRSAFRAVRSRGTALQGFDAIFSTYATFGSLWFGNALAKQNPNAVTVTDVRDAIVPSWPLWPTRRMLSLAERRAVRDASLVTVVSQGVKTATLEQRANRRYADKVTVLPNGFQQPKQAASESDEPASKRPLRIGYTGQVYGKSQDPEPLFREMAELLQADPTLQFELHYAGNQGHLMRAAAARYGVEHTVIDHGLLQHGEALELQGRMDMLLVLSWNTSASQGIISGKFGEYLARNRPILALVAGDVAGSELSEIIAEMNVGHCYEEAGGASARQSLSAYLREALRSASEGRKLPFDPVASAVDFFRYDSIAARLEGLIRQQLER